MNILFLEIHPSKRLHLKTILHGNPGQYALENKGIAWPKTPSQSFQENWANLAWKSRPVGTGDQGQFGMKIKANLAWKFRQTSQYFTFLVYQGKYSHIRQVETDGLPKAARLLHRRKKRPCDLITISRSFVHPWYLVYPGLVESTLAVPTRWIFRPRNRAVA